MTDKNAQNPALSINLTDRVTGMLREDISSGKYPPASQLPAGKDLATSFRVSITVIREALSQLKSDGFVVSRQGKGVFVANPRARPFRFDHPVAAENSLRNTFELRIAVEVQAAIIAAQRRKQSDLKAMARCLKQMEPGKYAFDEALSADLAFHLAIAKATQNPLISSFMEFLQPHLHDAIASARTVSALADVETLAYGEHLAIYEAIAESDPARAELATRQVLEGSLRRLTGARSTLGGAVINKPA